MRRGFGLLTLVVGWALLATTSCGSDEATGSSSGHTAYCHACSQSSDCASGNVCKVVQGALAVCAKSSDAQCCEESNPNNCYSLGGTVDGAGGSAGGGIIGASGKGGKAGSGSGSGGHGATAGTGGTGGSGGSTTTSNLGRACVKDTDCADSRLTCITNDAFSGDGPPKGFCTLSCMTGSECLDVEDNSYCAQFPTGDDYCVEGCTEGEASKCHERPEVGCTLIGIIPNGNACTSSSDCNPDELCDSQTSECGQIVTGCMPICGGDFDCGPGQHCDFSSGFCTAAKPTGLPLGSTCTVPTGNQADPCDGFCLPGSQDRTKGECTALCTVNPTFSGCGWEGQGTGPADNACLFQTLLSNNVSKPANNDLGLCGKMCDCNADCTVKGDYCMDETQGNVMLVLGRPGYCRPLLDNETASDSFSQCPPGHGGGTGGTGGSTTGGAGEAGAGAGGQASK